MNSLKLNNENTDANLLMAENYTALNLIDQAQKYWNKTILLTYNNPSLFSKYSKFLLENKKDSITGKRYLEKCIRFEPNNTSYLIDYANFLALNKEDTCLANEYYQKTIDLGTMSNYAIISYTNYLIAKGKNQQKAHAIFKSYINKKNNNCYFLYKYATFLERIMNMKDSAGYYYQYSYTINCKSSDFYSNYANFLSNNGGDPKFIDKLFSNSITIDTTSWTAYYNYSVFCYKKLKNIDKAKYLMEQAVKYNRYFYLGYFELSNISIKQNNLPEAISYFEKGCINFPHNSIITSKNKAGILNIKYYQTVKNYYESAIKLNPNNSDLYFTYSVFLFNYKKDIKIAKKMYHKSIALNPKLQNSKLDSLYISL